MPERGRFHLVLSKWLHLHPPLLCFGFDAGASGRWPLAITLWAGRVDSVGHARSAGSTSLLSGVHRVLTRAVTSGSGAGERVIGDDAETPRGGARGCLAGKCT
jgi:hypothetical protein